MPGDLARHVASSGQRLFFRLSAVIDTAANPVGPPVRSVGRPAAGFRDDR
jgi:hypothetical protein